jgi:DNA-binding GntR family transcriptional regulator
VHIRNKIAYGELRPDDRIRQELIASELNLSIVPVREALKMLEAEGLVAYRPHHGYQIARLNLKEFTEVNSIREILEREAITRAIPRLTEEDFQRLYDAIQDCKVSAANNDMVALCDANHRFHFILFEAADMPRLTNFIRMLWQITDPYRFLYYADPAHRHQINDEHDAIMQAARNGDVRLTSLLVDEHRINGITSLRRMLTNSVRPEE